MSDYIVATYLFIYIVVIIYFVVLGCYMLAQRDTDDTTHGEWKAKRRMTRSVGVMMFVWAFSWLIYLYPLLLGLDYSHLSYKICFLVTLMVSIPVLFSVMSAIVQKPVNNNRWLIIIGIPFLLPIIAIFLVPSGPMEWIPVYVSSALCLICIAFLLIRYTSEYRAYVNRIQSEYSNISQREIVWSWWCFAGCFIQDIFFILYQLNWSVTLDVIYGLLTIINAAYLCYCTCRQKTLNEHKVEEDEHAQAGEEEKEHDKAFYAVVEHKLKSVCEERLMFLEPDLTRDMLCSQISVNRTYLGMYFRRRGITFYQYINALRIHYAVKLMQENPRMSICEISHLSGFRSQTTFRKVFQEVMGRLPSETKSRKKNSPM